MPTDESKWLEMMVESGQMSDENGYWHYNPKAIENSIKWVYDKYKKEH